MARERRKNISNLADTEVLLDVLGNETRRKILNLISHEPMYFNQLAREMQTGQQAILRHVKILEDTGLIKSYAMRSELAAPDRKYYRVNSSFTLSISISNDNFTVRNEDIEELRYKEADALYKKFDELDSITLNKPEDKDKNIKYIQRKSTILLGQILSKLQKNLEDTEGQILHLESRLNDLRALKQAIIKKIHDIEKENFDDLERRLICSIMEGPMCRKEEQLTISELAEILDKNEKTIKNALSRITDKLETGSGVYELFKSIS
ncbi:MAG: ArsR family transcriptional regulator [Nitrososphaeraceae archaeon]